MAKKIDTRKSSKGKDFNYTIRGSQNVKPSVHYSNEVRLFLERGAKMWEGKKKTKNFLH